MHALGAEDIARLSYEALGVREILSSVEAVAASALDALGVPACVSESQFWRLSLPAIFGLIYGGVEPVDAIALSLRHKKCAALRESRQDGVN